jgi:hypothetical protein
MCYEDGQLMAFVDGEGDDASRSQIDEHLLACTSCAGALSRIQADREITGAAMDLLRVTAERPAATAAEAPRTEADKPGAPAMAPVGSPPHDGPGRSGAWIARIGWRKLAAAAAAVLFASSFALAPVRTFAGEILKVFRVQRVQSISLTEQDIQSISESLSSGEGHVDLKELGDVWVDGAQGDSREVTVEEAQAALGFEVRLPAGVEGTRTLMLQAGQTVKFKLNAAKVNEVLAFYGAKTLLPDSVDGKEFTVKVPSVLMATIEKQGAAAKLVPVDPDDPSLGTMPAEPYITLVQARSPELTVPDGVDPLVLRDVLLNLPFLPQNVRDQLASISDWQHTMIVPNVGGQARDVTIGGVDAVVMTSSYGPDPSAPDAAAQEMTSIVWNQGDVIRGLNGMLSEKEATDLVGTMIR